MLFSLFERYRKAVAYRQNILILVIAFLLLLFMPVFAALPPE